LLYLPQKCWGLAINLMGLMKSLEVRGKKAIGIYRAKIEGDEGACRMGSGQRNSCKFHDPKLSIDEWHRRHCLWVDERQWEIRVNCSSPDRGYFNLRESPATISSA